MRWRRRPTTQQIESWLEHGTPSWVERWVEDPFVTGELERFTRLSTHDVHSLRTALEPSVGFHERTAIAVGDRVGDLERLGALIGLLGLGPRAVGSLIDRDPD